MTTQQLIKPEAKSFNWGLFVIWVGAEHKAKPHNHIDTYPPVLNGFVTIICNFVTTKIHL
jgi:hypothetical protein